MKFEDMSWNELVKEAQEMNEQIEAIGGGGVKGKLMPGAISAKIDVTSEMLRAAQIRSELGAFACRNLSGAYSMIEEMFKIMVDAAPVSAEPVAWMCTREDGAAVFFRRKQNTRQHKLAGWAVQPLYDSPTPAQTQQPEPPAGLVPVAAFDRLEALCQSQAARLLAIDDAQQSVSGADGRLSDDQVRAIIQKTHDDSMYGRNHNGWEISLVQAGFRAALAQQDADKVDALAGTIVGLKRYTYGYTDDGCGGARYLAAIEKPDGRFLFRDDVLAAIDAARKEAGQ